MYSAITWQHARQPKNRGSCEGAQATGKAHFRKCGDDFSLALWVEGEVIVQARFEAHACAPVVAMGSVGTELLRGLTLEQARQLLPTKLDQELGGLPLPKRHAILLFLEALHQAIETCSKNPKTLKRGKKS